jgi:hypothetical protein
VPQRPVYFTVSSILSQFLSCNVVRNTIYSYQTLKWRLTSRIVSLTLMKAAYCAAESSLVSLEGVQISPHSGVVSFSVGWGAVGV